jgi:hypothetical protein
LSIAKDLAGVNGRLAAGDVDGCTFAVLIAKR